MGDYIATRTSKTAEGIRQADRCTDVRFWVQTDSTTFQSAGDKARKGKESVKTGSFLIGGMILLETNTRQELDTRQRVGRHTPHRMEVWLIKIDRERESPFLRSGYFPAVVVSNEKSNINSDVVIVAPARTSPRRLDLPSHVWLTCENNPSLERDMTMLAEQMTSIDKRSLVKQLGKVTSEEDIEKVEIAVLKQLGFEVEE